MKKFTNFLIAIVLFISMILYGKADNISVDDLVKRINEVGSEITDRVTNEKQNFNEFCNVEYNNPNIIIICKNKDEETNQEIETQLVMTVENSVIYYRGDYKSNGQPVDKNSLDYLGKLLFEFISFGVIYENLATMKGYSLEDYKKHETEIAENASFKEMNNDEIFEKFGVAYYGEEGSEVIFKIDINNIKLPELNSDGAVKSENSNSNNESNITSKESITEAPTKEVYNPNTAVGSINILTGGLTVLAIGLIVIAKNKSKFTNI